MSKIESFEELHCWQAARMLVKDVYKLTAEGALGNDYDMRNQLRSAALSGMNNIAEGFGRFGNKEFIRFLDICAELDPGSTKYAIRFIGFVVLTRRSD